MGDALAVCLLELRNFSSADFAQFHPGGSLGKQLYLKVEDIYPSHPRPVIPMQASIKEVILAISSGRLGAAAVIGEGEKLMGIITDGDLRRMLEHHTNLTGLTAVDVMTRNPKTIEKSAFATRALEVMQKENISQLVVTDEERVAGFVHLHDLLKEGIA
jgi:arabinose-5-phosphate isomerase